MPRTGFKRPGRYAALAAAYYDDPAIIAVGTDAELWYVRALAWCAAHPETDGVIPLEVAVNRLGIPDAMSRVTECDRQKTTQNEPPRGQEKPASARESPNSPRRAMSRVTWGVTWGVTSPVTRGTKRKEKREKKLLIPPL